jgi:hypothetical protein
VELAGRRALIGAVRLAVDHHRAAAADALATIVIEGDRLLSAKGELLVDDIHHLEERCLGADVRRLVLDHFPRRARAGLPPDAQGDVHL